MSDTLLGVSIGAILTGVFLIVAQWMATRAQTNAAREAWERSNTAEQLAALESMYLEILRSADQVEDAVASWESGTLLSTQAHGIIGSGSRALEQAGLLVVLRNGLEDPLVGLITRLRTAARRYGDLNLVGRTPPATVDEKRAQATAVSAAADQLASHLHQGLSKASAKGN